MVQLISCHQRLELRPDLFQRFWRDRFLIYVYQHVPTCTNCFLISKALLRLLGIANAKQRKAGRPSELFLILRIAQVHVHKSYHVLSCFMRMTEGTLQRPEGQVCCLGQKCRGLCGWILGAGSRVHAAQTFCKVMIRLLTTVDDTVMLSKSMIAEWQQAAKIGNKGN